MNHHKCALLGTASEKQGSQAKVLAKKKQILLPHHGTDTNMIHRCFLKFHLNLQRQGLDAQETLAWWGSGIAIILVHAIALRMHQNACNAEEPGLWSWASVCGEYEARSSPYCLHLLLLGINHFLLHHHYRHQTHLASSSSSSSSSSNTSSWPPQLGLGQSTVGLSSTFLCHKYASPKPADVYVFDAQARPLHWQLYTKDMLFPWFLSSARVMLAECADMPSSWIGPGLLHSAHLWLVSEWHISMCRCCASVVDWLHNSCQFTWMCLGMVRLEHALKRATITAYHGMHSDSKLASLPILACQQASKAFNLTVYLAAQFWQASGVILCSSRSYMLTTKSSSIQDMAKILLKVHYHM